jgi:hypothetical protein
MQTEHIEDTGANMDNTQLQAAERAQQRLELENADLKQQLKSMESRYDSSRQVRLTHVRECMMALITEAALVAQASWSLPCLPSSAQQ